MSETDPGEIQTALLAQIEQPGKSTKRFIGATFGPLDLGYLVLESRDNYPIDLREATFTAESRWTYAIIRQPLHLEGAVFEEQADFVETRFETEVYLSQARFEAGCRFIEAQFQAGGWCYQTQFNEAEFQFGAFGGPMEFTEASFTRCDFRNSTFEARSDFDTANFKHAIFWGTQFQAPVSFDGSVLPEQVTFRNASFEDSCTFRELHLSGEQTRIDLRDASVSAGTLEQPSDGQVYYDLANAVVGDVSIGEPPIPVPHFKAYRFENTNFDGFDFSQYRDALRAIDWKLHSIQERCQTGGSEEPTKGRLEGTYLKAKNGANRMGDTKAASEFFRQELLYRRRQYASTVLDPGESWWDRAAGLWRWGANGTLSVTTGYGERPSRVVLTSMGVVLLFAGVFSMTQVQPPYGSALGYLILSLESFITLVLGGAAEIEAPWIRLIAQIEGFIGAFLIALFVFTLTRSIHR